jgi:hypothetical protein
MSGAKRKNETVLQELIELAGRVDIQVRTEKLHREVGYRAQSGRCRLQKKDLIILDRDAPVRDQIEFLTGELLEHGLEGVDVPGHLSRLLNPPRKPGAALTTDAA